MLEDDVMVNPMDERTALERLEPDAWAVYLEEHSGLPGPRANLTLVQAAADTARAEVIDSLLQNNGEYQAMCAAAAAGRRASDGSFELLARSLAADDRWRVREGVVIGLQLLGDHDPGVLSAIVSDWVTDRDPLIVRAAVTTICEPRLIRTPVAARIALDICGRATSRLLEIPLSDRRRPAARTLRQALGYCWSVAVVADPETGLPAFTALSHSADPDVAWIVRENRRKKRLAEFLAPPSEP
ncbi:HEAT repeat domain-containing protein [Plantibacter sp. MPB07]|uniref:HEAT repeat domain-containing protein n=1 Tax=Plantibacter sp. MPB07 TaxID=3388853 RepID=UPI00398872B7